jgi:hypothetical protein
MPGSTLNNACSSQLNLSSTYITPAGLQLDPFNLDLKIALQKASDAVLRVRDGGLTLA